MKNFTKGVLVGVGLGLLFAPMKGTELRRVLAERATEWRNSLPEDSRINQYANQVSARVADAKENWRVYARQAASKAKDTGTTLGSKARHTSQEMAGRAKQTGQELAGRAKQTGQELAGRAKQTGQELADKARHTSQEMTHRTKQTAGSVSGSDGSGTRATPERND